MDKVLTTIPFAGFYESVHDRQLDDTVDQMLSDSSGCHPASERLVERFWDECNFTGVHEKYAKAYAEALADEIGVAFTFESLNSPREYNFTTDRIFVEIERAEVLRLREAVSERVFRDLARERFTSCDGFSSFYSPYADDWGPVEEWDHNQIGTLIEACVLEHYEDRTDGFDRWAELELMDSFRDNGYFDNWISEASEVNNRLANIASYLRQREDRAFR